MRAHVATFAAAAYRTGGLQEVTVLTDRGGVQDVLNRLGALDSIARSQREALTALAVAKHQQVAQADARRAVAGRQAVADRLAATKASLEADAERMSALLTQLQAQQAEEIRQAEQAAARAAVAHQAEAEAAAQRAAAAARTRQSQLVPHRRSGRAHQARRSRRASQVRRAHRRPRRPRG